MVTRSALLRPYYLVLLAGALLRAGLLARAQATLDESAHLADGTGQHAYVAEHARLQAEVSLATRAFEQAEESYRTALTASRLQGARWLELRAARGLAAFLIAQDRTDEAREILSPIVNWFTEGKDTMDYLYADSLMKTFA
jgi:predicted ATPase